MSRLLFLDQSLEALIATPLNGIRLYPFTATTVNAMRLP